MDTNQKLVIYKNLSELHKEGQIEVFKEGIISESAKRRYNKITGMLADGFLKNEIEKCLNSPDQLRQISLLDEQHKNTIENIVAAVTGDVGRAVTGLSVLQCTIKTIEPKQSVRLHKGGRSSKDFSWQEGISMRTLDNTFITPILREYNLLKLNKDGFMMTRTLAENYPYSSLYKAKIKGARDSWIELVDFLEKHNDEQFSRGCLQYLLSKLINNAQEFEQLANESESYVEKINKANIKFDDVISLMSQHWNEASYASRLMEVSMHSFMQACVDMSLLDAHSLVPLSQMRSANKKHNNIGDIELQDNNNIIESWDAKYGKTYFYDELEELSDKLEKHPFVRLAGFVSSGDPELRKDITYKMCNISEQFGAEIKVFSFKEWISFKLHDFSLTDNEKQEFGEFWLLAYTESLSLKRKNVAPIDEPCYAWLKVWHEMLEKKLKQL